MPHFVELVCVCLQFTANPQAQYQTRAEQKTIPADREAFTQSDLIKLAELQPPDIMPNGNVGTPTAVFLQFIRECRLPPKMIQKLGLTFPRNRSNKRYGNVPFDYGSGDIAKGREDSEFVATGAGHEISNTDEKQSAAEANAEGESGETGLGKEKQKGKSKKFESEKAREPVNEEENQSESDEVKYCHYIGRFRLNDNESAGSLASYLFHAQLMISQANQPMI